MKKFLIKIMIVLLLVLPFLALSIWADPYSVFHSNDVRITKIESNSNYIKTKYILENPQKFNAFVFGSSRAGVINTQKIKNGNYYNMYYSEGVPSEHIENIKTFIRKGVDIQEVVIVLDNIAPFVDPEMHKSQDIRRPYQAGQSDLFFLAHYLNPAKTIKSFQIVNPFAKKIDNNEYYSIGWICALEEMDQEIEASPQTHAQKQTFTTPQWGEYFSYRGEEALEELKTLIEYCRKKDIKTTVCVCPLYKETYLKSVENGYLDYLAGIAEITPFYSFTGINSVTENPYYYYENSHYRRIVGDMMIACIYENECEEKFLEEGFGVYVDASNSHEYIEKLKEQLQ